MAKVKLTKNELRLEKENLRRFRQYLPMLQMKKQQLQLETGKVQHALEELSRKREELKSAVDPWVDVFAEQPLEFERILKVKEIQTEEGNIAGVDIPVYVDVIFEKEEYDLMFTPLWVDKAIEVCMARIRLNARIRVYHRQMEVLAAELRTVTQRVNLFEKVKIPEALENIRIIQIYLGDLQTAQVIRGKIAKRKIEQRQENFKLQ